MAKSIEWLTMLRKIDPQPDVAIEPAERCSDWPRYSLRMLFLVTAALGAVFAVMVRLDFWTDVAIALGGLLIAGHVIGNSIGTRLRDSSPQRSARRDDAEVQPAQPKVHLAPPKLAGTARFPSILLPATTLGASIGALLGGSGLATIYPDAPNSAILLGVVSSAVLAGFACCAAFSFASIMRQAIREACRVRDPFTESQLRVHRTSGHINQPQD